MSLDPTTYSGINRNPAAIGNIIPVLDAGNRIGLPTERWQEVNIGPNSGLRIHATATELNRDHYTEYGLSINTADERLTITNGGRNIWAIDPNGVILFSGETHAGVITASNIGVANNLTVSGNLSVLGTSNLTTLGITTETVSANEVVGGNTNTQTLTVINNETIGGTLSVLGTTTLSGNLIVLGTTSITTDTVSSNEVVTGNISASSISVSGSLASKNTSATGLTISGNSTVTGNQVIGGTLSTAGNVTLSGNLTVLGTTSLQSTSLTTETVSSSEIVTGNINTTSLTTATEVIGNTLSVGGITTLSGNLSVLGTSSHTGDSTFGTLTANRITDTGPFIGNSVSTTGLTVSGNADVSGNTALVGNLTIQGNLTVNGTNNISSGGSGSSTSSPFLITGPLSATTITTSGNVALGGTLSVANTVTLSGNLNVLGTETVAGNLSTSSATVTGNEVIGGTLSVGGNTLLSGNLQFSGTTASFPELKRSDTSLQVRLADDSNFADFKASTITSVSTVQLPSTGALQFSGLSRIRSNSNLNIIIDNGTATNGTYKILFGTGTGGTGLLVDSSLGYMAPIAVTSSGAADIRAAEFALWGANGITNVTLGGRVGGIRTATDTSNAVISNTVAIVDSSDTSAGILQFGRGTGSTPSSAKAQLHAVTDGYLIVRDGGSGQSNLAGIQFGGTSSTKPFPLIRRSNSQDGIDIKFGDDVSGYAPLRTGLLNVSGVLATTDNTQIGGTLSVANATTLSGNLQTIGTTAMVGNVRLGGTLSVANNTTLSGNLSLPSTGSIAFSGEARLRSLSSKVLTIDDAANSTGIYQLTFGPYTNQGGGILYDTAASLGMAANIDSGVRSWLADRYNVATNGQYTNGQINQFSIAAPNSSLSNKVALFAGAGGAYDGAALTFGTASYGRVEIGAASIAAGLRMDSYLLIQSNLVTTPIQSVLPAIGILLGGTTASFPLIRKSNSQTGIDFKFGDDVSGYVPVRTGLLNVSGVLATTGNTQIGGTLSAVGITTLSGNLSVLGTTAMIGDVLARTLTATSFTNSGNSILGGTLSVASTTTLSGNLLASADKTLDIGTTVTRFRDNYHRRTFTNGTALVAGDFSVSAGWGSGATISSITGDDSHAQFTITSGTGTSADPTIVLTFKDGTWTNAPFSFAKLVSPSSALSTPITESTTATTLTITFVGTPDPSTAYVLKFHTQGI